MSSFIPGDLIAYNGEPAICGFYTNELFTTADIDKFTTNTVALVLSAPRIVVIEGRTHLLLHLLTTRIIWLVFETMYTNDDLDHMANSLFRKLK